MGRTRSSSAPKRAGTAEEPTSPILRAASPANSDAESESSQPRVGRPRTGTGSGSVGLSLRNLRSPSSRPRSSADAPLSPMHIATAALSALDKQDGIQYTSNPLSSSLVRLAGPTDIVTSRTLTVPIRELLQYLYSYRRRQSIADALQFVFFFGLFIAITALLYDVPQAFYTSDAVGNLFVDQELPNSTFKQTFTDIKSQDLMWTWIRGPLYSGLFSDSWYNGQPKTSAELGYIMTYSRIVGGVQLRQLRVKSQPCVSPTLRNVTQCYPEFVDGVTDSRQAFGPPQDPTRYKWSDGHSQLRGLFEYGPSYGTGGFVEQLPINATAALAKIQQLVDDKWTDSNTRVMAISFNLYNTNTKLLATVRATIEFPNSALGVASWICLPIRVAPYVSRTDVFRAALEIVFCIWLLACLFLSLKDITAYRTALAYFANFHNVYHLCFLVFGLCYGATWGVFLTLDGVEDFDVNAASYLDMFETSEQFMFTMGMSAAFGLLGFFRIFQMLGLSKNMNAFWRTINKAAADLVVFALGLLLVLMGFSFLGHIIFGGHVKEFHTLLTSFLSLLRALMGDFNYDGIVKARPALAAPYFTVYIVTIFMIMLNMFIGIITKYFENIKAESRELDKWKLSARTWEAQMVMRVTDWWHTCPCRRRSGARADYEKVAAMRRAEREAVDSLYSAMGVLLTAARRNTNSNLVPFFRRLMTESTEKSIYIHLHELCWLSSAIPCNNHISCPARQAVDAFHRVKTMLIVGPKTEKFMPLAGELAAAYQPFEVLKVSMSNAVDERVMVINPHKAIVLNFDRKMRLVKKLPLAQLVQIEEHVVDRKRLILTFTSAGMTRLEEQSCGPGSMDTTYDLIFTEGAVWRDIFVKRIMDAHRAMASGTTTDDSARQQDQALARLVASSSSHIARAAGMQMGALPPTPDASADQSAVQVQKVLLNAQRIERSLHALVQQCMLQPEEVATVTECQQRVDKCLRTLQAISMAATQLDGALRRVRNRTKQLPSARVIKA